MSFLEFWGERVDPGKVGTIDFSGEHEACQCRPLVLARFVFVVAALPVLWYLAIPRVPLPLWQAAGLVVGGTLMYVALSYLVNPQPDLENLGFLGGMVNDPTRRSDNQNRLLLNAQMLLGPGRFVAESLLDMRCFFAGGRDDASGPGEETWPG